MAVAVSLPSFLMMAALLLLTTPLIKLTVAMGRVARWSTQRMSCLATME